MVHFAQLTKRSVVSVVAVLVMVGFPATTSVVATAAGTTRPTGVTASTYTYNPNTGLWENPYYTWNPITKQTTPKTSDNWVYIASHGQWVDEGPINPPAAPTSGNSGTNGGTTTTGPSAPTTQTSGGGSSTSSTTTPGAVAASTTNPGAGSTNNSSAAIAGTTADGTAFAAAIVTNVGSQAGSGDVNTSRNTVAGSSTSGDASAQATVINLLQSTASFANAGGATVFTSDINNNVDHDLVIDPSLLATLQPASTGAVLPSNVSINNQASGTITNNIDIGSNSGNVGVAQNTKAGDATSGNANSVANLVNAMSSTLVAPQTFIGNINIYGNLNGNILLPGDVLQSLLASNANTGPASTNTNSATQDSGLNVNSASAQTINNNVATAASSGAVDVVDNTIAGNATSGSATTKLTLLNLTGHQVIAANSLLVFVNVLGHWVGMIMDAPAGSTAAALGGGVNSNTTVASANTDINSNVTQTINNNVKVGAASGDVSVTGNTKAGNATSGNASASANILNLTNDNLALSNWFGILFINVFGTWNGSFCPNPSECAPAAPTGSSTTTGGTTTGKPAATTLAGGTFAQTAAQVQAAFASTTDAGGSGNTANASNGNVLGSSTTNHHSGPTSAKTPQLQVAKKNFGFMLSGLGLSTLLLLTERLLTLRRSRHGRAIAQVS